MKRIPKCIMQTWKTAVVPDKWKASQESILRLMPEWKYTLLTDKENLEFVKLHFPHLQSFYSGLKYNIQRADVIRYMWLYVHGGIYIDLDIELVAPLDELFDGRQETWLLKAPRNFAGHYTNFLMASTAQNPFWLDVLAECQKPLPYWAVLTHHIVSQQTGLAALSRAVKHYQKPIALLPQDVLVPCDYCSPHACSKPYSYTRFLPGQSWNGWDTKAINIIMCNPHVILLICIFLLTLKFVSK